MMNRRRLLGAGLGVPTLASCGVFEPSYTLQYRLKVRIYCGGRSHEGSSVLKTNYTRYPKSTLDVYRTWRATAWGESIVIDCGSRGLLFGLLGNSEGTGDGPCFDPLAEQAFLQMLPSGQNTLENFQSGRGYELATELSGERDWPEGSWPVLIRFDDVANAATMRLVTEPSHRRKYPPTTAAETLTTALGADARIERVSIEMTPWSPITNRIRGVLPWLRTYNGVNGSYRRRFPARLEDTLIYSNFKMDGDFR